MKKNRINKTREKELSSKTESNRNKNFKLSRIFSNRYVKKVAEIVFALSLVLGIETISGKPEPAKAIGVTPKVVKSLPQIDSSQSSNLPRKHVVSIPYRNDKIIMQIITRTSDSAATFIIYSKNKKILKDIFKIRAGADWKDIVWIIIVLIGIGMAPEEVVAFIQNMANYNAPNIGGTGYFPSASKDESRRTVILYTGNTEEESNTCTAATWPWQTPDGNPCTQAQSFCNSDGTVDLDRAYAEVLRRAGDSETFNCSKERFIDLATEKGEINSATTREAITALQLEIDGVTSNTRRNRAAEAANILGSDFLIDGPNGETCLEIKGPVDSIINKAEGVSGSIKRQARQVGRKINYQVNEWSKKPTSKDKALISVTNSNKVLVVVDLFDVSVGEKNQMQRDIKESARAVAKSRNNTEPKIQFINNVINR